MKRSYIPLVAAIAFVLGAAGVILLCPPAAAWIKGIFMIFQQRSAHVLLGSISGSAHPPLTTILLSAWQGAFLPWQPCRTAIAAAAVMGPAAAAVLCLLGRLLSSCLWYGFARSLFYPFAKNSLGRRALGPAVALGLLLPGWTGPLAAVPGALAAPSSAALPLMVLAAAPQLVLTACLCSLMSATLSVPWSWVSPGLGVITALVITVLTLTSPAKRRS